MEVKQAELRALALVEEMKGSLAEHRLTAQVKQAREAEAECQAKLTKSGEEMRELRGQLDGAQR